MTTSTVVDSGSSKDKSKDVSVSPRPHHTKIDVNDKAVSNT